MENSTPETTLLSIRDTAKRLSISEKTLFNLTKAGRLKAVRIGPRCVRYSLADIQAFIDRCKGVEPIGDIAPRVLDEINQRMEVA